MLDLLNSITSDLLIKKKQQTKALRKNKLYDYRNNERYECYRSNNSQIYFTYN